MPTNGRPPLRPVIRAPGSLQGAAVLSQQRASWTRTYLGLLQEPDVVQHVRELLTSGSATEVAALLQALLRVLVPPEKGPTNANVSVTLSHDVPRPPLDVTP